VSDPVRLQQHPGQTVVALSPCTLVQGHGEHRVRGIDEGTGQQAGGEQQDPGPEGRTLTAGGPGPVGREARDPVHHETQADEHAGTGHRGEEYQQADD
jgi:hypothetical protein